MEANYLSAIKEHAEKCRQELEYLSNQSKKQKLNQTEYYAAERLLQVIIEAAIGFCKQWVKKINKTTPTDAYASFVTLHEAGRITAPELDQWKKIIGLRNILVHDYLNIEHKVIDSVLKKHLYHFIFNFISKNNFS